MALGPQEEFEKEEEKDAKEEGSQKDEKEKGEAEEDNQEKAPSKPAKVAGTGGALSGKAFQRLEFLVWSALFLTEMNLFIGSRFKYSTFICFFFNYFFSLFSINASTVFAFFLAFISRCFYSFNLFEVRDWPEIELLNEEFMDSYIRKTVSSTCREDTSGGVGVLSMRLLLYLFCSSRSPSMCTLIKFRF